MPAPRPSLRLRDSLSSCASSPLRSGGGLSLGVEDLDRRLTDVVRQKALHEIHVSSLHAPAGEAFGLAIALRSARSVVWICDARAHCEVGALYGPGLQEWGAEAEGLLLARVRTSTALLAAGEDALRSGAFEAVLMSAYGESPAFSLTNSRRLSLAAAQGGTAAILIRVGAAPRPSAAETRWSIEAAPSAPLDARAPGRPAFRVSLLRSRAGLATGEWIMEWDRESRSFVEPAASGRLVSLSARRPAGVRAA